MLYVLLEHQSSVDRWMALRMLRYVVRQVEHWRQQHPESTMLPVIIPLVMYHGPDGAWSAPRRVEDLFELPGEGEQREQWRALVPRFEYLLDDLTAERAEALMARPGPPLAQLAWLVLRYGRTAELADRLPEWTALFAQMRAGPDGAEYLVVVIRYLLSIGDKSSRAAARQVLHSVIHAQQAEAVMERWVEEFILRGPEAAERVLREEGRQKGLIQGRAESVLRILIVRGVQVSDEARQRILACTDMATLDRWFDRAMCATNVSYVLDYPMS